MLLSAPHIPDPLDAFLPVRMPTQDNSDYELEVYDQMLVGALNIFQFRNPKEVDHTGNVSHDFIMEQAIELADRFYKKRLLLFESRMLHKVAKNYITEPMPPNGTITVIDDKSNSHVILIKGLHRMELRDAELIITCTDEDNHDQEFKLLYNNNIPARGVEERLMWMADVSHSLNI